MMQPQTVLFILLSAIVALALVLFQYYYKGKRKGKLWAILSFCRFFAVFGILLLIVNPKFVHNEYTIEKTNLIVLTDNSSSITSEDKLQLVQNLEAIKGNASGLLDRFNVVHYNFGAGLTNADSLALTEKSTNISKALTGVNGIYTGTNSAVVLFSDGNQTIGEDYEFYGKKQNFPIYTVVLGDTTSYEDVRIDRVNTNKYAFLKNKFPLEVFISYDGNGDITTEVQIFIDGKIRHREKVSLSYISNTKVVNTELEATSVGMKKIKVMVAPVLNEKNQANNEKALALEVLDEKTNVAIISNRVHPDIGALKKAIETNEQRMVTIYTSDTDVDKLDGMDVCILYQPDASFDRIYKYIQLKKSNVFTILGTQTDLDFINTAQENYIVETAYPLQEVFAVPNKAFSRFDISGLSFEGFPPLETNAGPINIQGVNEPLLGMRIKGMEMDRPLWAVMEEDRVKQAVLVGENIWKWRLQSYRNDQTFKSFDDFLGKLILYLSSSKSKDRFVLDYSPTYNNSNEAKIRVVYFDRTFAFDTNASINIKVMDTVTDKSIVVPMLLKEGYYEADLSNLPSGEYRFTATVVKENLSKSAHFSILDFDAEKQFSSSDYRKLKRLANDTGGKLYFLGQERELIKELDGDPRFVPTQKSKQIVVPLIDFKFLLGVIIAALSVEWFIRKYNGLT